MSAETQANGVDFNPYDVLGIRKWASIHDIKRAYYGLVRKYSPELYPEKFIEIRRAFDVLRYPQKRAQADLLIYNEIPGNIGFKGIEIKTESLVKLNKAIKDLEGKNWENDPALRAEMLNLLKKRSLVYVSKSYWHEAIADWNRILQVDSKDREARRNLVQGYARLGYSYALNGFLPKAVDVWREILKHNPRCLEAIHNIAIASTHLKNAAQEKEFWEKTLDLWSEQLNGDGSNDYLKNLIVETHKYFGGRFISQKKSVYEAPRHQEVIKQIGGFEENKQLGEAFLGNQNWAQAINSFEKCLEEKPDNLEILNMLGWAYLNSGSINKAFSCWKKAYKIAPNDPKSLENLVQGHLTVGKGLRAQKAFGQALVHFKSIQKLMPQLPEALMEIGTTYALKGDYQAAIEQWQEVLRLDPDNKFAKKAIQEARRQVR